MRGNEGRRADAHSYIHPLFCQAYTARATAHYMYIMPRPPPRAGNMVNKTPFLYSLLQKSSASAGLLHSVFDRFRTYKIA
jgi:hypothetical protein